MTRRPYSTYHWRNLLISATVLAIGIGLALALGWRP